MSKFRVQKLCKEQLLTGKSPKEDRGGDRNSKLFDVKRNSVKTHIESFVPLESHYCRNNSKPRYLNNDLSVKKMWELYNASIDYYHIVQMILLMYSTDDMHRCTYSTV